MATNENGGSSWSLEVLRPQPVIRRDGEEITLGARGGVSLAFVIYLILTREEGTGRAELIQLLQAMAGGALTRDRLRRIIHDLRNALGPDVIEGAERVQWVAPVSVDAEELLALRPETMEDDTLNLYQGDFLAGWDERGHAGGFWSWAKARRDEYRRHALSLLDRRGSEVAEIRDWERLRAIGRRISTLWPSREEGYLWELSALEQLERFAEARERYADAERTLAGRGARPSAPLNELSQRLRMQQQEEMSRRAAEPLQLRADTAAHGPARIETVTGVGPEMRTADTPFVADSPEVRLPVEAEVSPTESDVAPVAGLDTTIPSPPAVQSGWLDAASNRQAPSQPQRLDGIHRPSGVASLTGRWLVWIAILVTSFLAALAFVSSRRGADTDGAGVTASDVGSTCRNGTGRGALVREVYHAGEGIDAGAEFTKAWYLLNDGRCSWGPDFIVVWQSPSKADEERFIVNADTIRLGKRVLPGDSVIVRIPMRAPDLHGFVRERWSIFDSSGGTVNIEGSPYLPVALIVRKHPVPLCRPEEVAAELVATNHHRERQAVPAGVEFPAEWSLINLRLCAWPADTRLRRMGSSEGVLSGAADAVSAGDVVLPGETVTLRVPMRAPARIGIFSEQWELATNDGLARAISGAPSVRIRIQTASPGETAQLRAPRCAPGQAVASFQSETIRDHTVLSPDQPFEKTWTLRNAGTCRWEAPMKLRLEGSTGPRLSLVDEVPVEGMVVPEKTYTFTVRMRTPLKPGTYSESWQLIGPGGETVPIPNKDKVWVTIRVR